MSATVPVGILTVSDRAAAGTYEDRGGPGVVAVLTEALTTPWHAVRRTVPDERDEVEVSLIELSDTCPLVVTAGGTGPAPRDITPDATEAICDRLLPGFGELMRTCLLAVLPAVPYGVDLIGGPHLDLDPTVATSLRPASSPRA